MVDPGASRFALYIVATNQSDYAILCAGATWKDADGCENLMRIAELEGGEVVAPGANASLAHQLERLIAPLKEQSDLVSGLATAGSAGTVARNARHLERLFHRAGRSLTALEAPPRNQQVVTALADTLVAEADGLGELAMSTRSPGESTYEIAALAVETSSRAVRTDLRHLRRSGFADLPMLPLVSVPPLPAVESSALTGGTVQTLHQESGAPPPYEGEEKTPPAPGGEWEEAEEVGKAGGNGTTGQPSEPNTEPAEPVEAQGAK